MAPVVFPTNGTGEDTVSAKENRESFCRRLRPILSNRDLMFVEIAYILAKHGHRAQTRKEIDPATGKPVRYFEHCRRVALTLIDEFKCVDPVMIMAAITHDCPEDTEIVTSELIEVALGAEVARIVKMLSKIPKEGYLERLVAYADWRILVIKACDRLDNLRTLGSGSLEFQKKQIAETEEKYFPVFDLMVKLTPKQHVAGAKYLRERIRCIVRSYKAAFKAADCPRAAAARPARRKRP
ncbi:MAG: hypothetical protein RL272_949 [Candidatus Parcubacteria bacterium]|jgi:(p)ppGpp synthase/HD superfamily hydrolase